MLKKITGELLSGEIMSKIELESVFFAISEPLKVLLTSASESITHPVTKGGASEYQWINWLKSYLPERYEANSGFVIDSEANISEQQDIIIYDRQYTPYLLNRDGVLFVPAESVYAVLEVKPKLNKRYLDYASKKINSVRMLKRVSRPTITTITGETSSRTIHEIIGGFLSIYKVWNEGVYSKNLKKYLQIHSDKGRINIGCCLESGSFIVNYENNLEIKTSRKDATLIYFFINFITLLQDCGTCPPIDFIEYSKKLKHFEK